MVDDGSKDKTGEIAARLVSENKNLRLVTLHPNRGYGAALKAGFEHAQYKYVVFTDGDMQFDFSELDKFVENITSADISLVLSFEPSSTIIISHLCACFSATGIASLTTF